MSLGKNERIALWDNMKFFLIALVVIGHIVDFATSKSPICRSIYLYIYTFHMPLFIFISGLFFRSKNVFNKVLFLIIFGFITKILLSVTPLLLGGGIRGFRLLADGGIPWFMFALAAFYTLGYILRQQNKTLILCLSITIACFVGYDKSIGNYLYLSRIIIFFPFFWFGTMISSDLVIKYRNCFYWRKFSIAFALLALICFVCIYYLQDVYTYRGLFNGRYPFNPVMRELGPLHRTLCYIVTVLMCWSIIIITPKFKIPLISTWGTRSLSVYFWHFPAISIWAHYSNFAELSKSSFGLIILITGGLIITIILSSKPFDYLLTSLRNTINLRPSPFNGDCV